MGLIAPYHYSKDTGCAGKVKNYLCKCSLHLFTGVQTQSSFLAYLLGRTRAYILSFCAFFIFISTYAWSNKHMFYFIWLRVLQEDWSLLTHRHPKCPLSKVRDPCSNGLQLSIRGKVPCLFLNDENSLCNLMENSMDSCSWFPFWSFNKGNSLSGKLSISKNIKQQEHWPSTNNVVSVWYKGKHYLKSTLRYFLIKAA